MAQIRFAGREGEHIELTRSALDLLDDGLDGRLIRRGADSYDKARQVWNGMVDKRSAALAAPGASSQTSHFGRRPGFVDKDQAGGIEIGLAVEPRQPAQGDVRPLLLGGVRGFF